VEFLGLNWHTETDGMTEGYFALFCETMSTDVSGLAQVGLFHGWQSFTKGYENCSSLKGTETQSYGRRAFSVTLRRVRVTIVAVQKETVKGKDKAVPLQTRRGPEGSRKLRFPDFVTTAQDGGRLSALRTGRLYPQGMLLVPISVKRLSRLQGHSAIGRILCQWKIHWHQLGSNQRPFDL